MTEKEFWLALEFRTCGEFAGMPERHLRFLWCDGFIPEQYLLNDPTPRIAGRAWIVNGQKQDTWEFTLFLPCQFASVEEIEWGSLLPPRNVTRWVALDPSRRRLEIEPSAAVPDLELTTRIASTRSGDVHTSETPKPLWRRKRWAVAGVLWLLAVPVLYFLAEGPFAYAAGYGGPWSDAFDVLVPGFTADPFLGVPPFSGLRSAHLDAWASLPHFYDVSVRWEPAR